MGGSISLNMPGPTSAKNSGLAAAASQLGMGDQLRQQLEDEVQKRKKDQDAQAIVQQNGNAISPAVLATFAKGTNL